MLEQIKILTSRRSYEFRPDDLRLSMLSIKPVQDHIQKLFNFQGVIVGSPASTFGDVPLTLPPGLVFTTGMCLLSENEQLTPIRFLNVEQHRIVIDVAGTSSIIDEIFDKLRDTLSELHAPDGAAIIAEPEKILNYSEITAHFTSPLDSILNNPLRKLLRKFASQDMDGNNSILVPTLAIQAYPASQQLPAVPGANDNRVFTFAQRAGTRPEEQVYFSGAPLDSEKHMSYLEELEALLTS